MRNLSKYVLIFVLFARNLVFAQGYLSYLSEPLTASTFLDTQRGLFEVSRLVNQCSNSDLNSYNGFGLDQNNLGKISPRYLSFQVRKPETCNRITYRTIDTFLDSFSVNNLNSSINTQYLDPENHCVFVNGYYVNIQVVSQCTFRAYSQAGSIYTSHNYKWDWQYCLITKFDTNFAIVKSKSFLIKGTNAELQYTDSGFVLGFVLLNDVVQLYEFDWNFNVKKQSAFDIKGIVNNPKEFLLDQGEKGVFTLVKTNDNQGYWVVLSGMIPPEIYYYKYPKKFNGLDWNAIDRLERKVLLLKLDNNLKLTQTYQLNDGTIWGTKFPNKLVVTPKNITYYQGKLSFIFNQYSQGVRYVGVAQFEKPDTCSYFRWVNYDAPDSFYRYHWFTMPNNPNLISTVVVDRKFTYTQYVYYQSLGFLERTSAGWNLLRNSFDSIIPASKKVFTPIYANLSGSIVRNSLVRDRILPENGSYHPKIGMSYTMMHLRPNPLPDAFVARNGYSLGFRNNPLEICTYYRSQQIVKSGADSIKGGLFFSIPNLKEVQPQKVNFKDVNWEIVSGLNFSKPILICSPFQPTISDNIYSKDIVVCGNDSVVLKAGIANFNRPYKIKWSTGDTTVSIVVRKSGDYSFVLNFPDGCADPVSTSVKFAPRKTVKPIKDTIVCEKESVLFDLYADALKNQWKTVTWSDTLTGLVQILSKPGKYRLKLENDSGCVYQDSFELRNFDKPNLPQLKDSIFCLNQDRFLIYPLNIEKVKSPLIWSSTLNSQGGTPNLILSKSLQTAISETHVYRLTNQVSGKQITIVQVKDGCENLVADTVISFVRYPLQVNFLGDTLVCEGDTFNLFVEGSGGDTGAYQFVWGDGKQTGNSAKEIASESKRFFVALRDNCTNQIARDTLDVQVVPKLILELDDDQICEGDTYCWRPVIKGGRQQTRQFQWQVSDPTAVTNGLKQSVLQLMPKANVLAKITMNDGVCVAVEDSGWLMVREQPDARVNDVGISACEPFYFDLKPLKLAKDRAAVWYWNVDSKGNTFDNFGNLNLVKDLVSVDQLYGLKRMAGKYQYAFIHRINYSNGFYCADTFVTSTLTVKSRPKATGFASPSITNLENPQSLISNLSVADSMKYVVDKNGKKWNTDSFVCQFSDTGVYRFNVVAVGKNGCMDTAIVNVFVKDVVKVYIPNAFTPNLDGLNDYFTYYLRGVADYEMEIYDRWGAKVCTSNLQEAPINNGYVKMNFCLLGDGVYAYKLKCRNMEGKMLGFSGTIVVVR